MLDRNENSDGDVTADNDASIGEVFNGSEDNDLFHVCWYICAGGKPPAAPTVQCSLVLTYSLFITFFASAD